MLRQDDSHLATGSNAPRTIEEDRNIVSRTAFVRVN